MGNRHQEPGGRAEDRRRQFEDSRGLTGRRELPLDDEPAADEADADEPEADGPEGDGPEGDGPEGDELSGAPDEVSSPAEDQADDQR